MELVDAFLSVLLVGLSVLLATVGFLANRYFPDRRFLLVGVGLLALGAVGVLSLLSTLFSQVGTLFAVGEVPLAILVATVLLLNASLFRRKGGRGERDSIG